MPAEIEQQLCVVAGQSLFLITLMKWSHAVFRLCTRPAYAGSLASRRHVVSVKQGMAARN
jgi:hypothetical protein